MGSANADLGRDLVFARARQQSCAPVPDWRSRCAANAEPPPLSIVDRDYAKHREREIDARTGENRERIARMRTVTQFAPRGADCVEHNWYAPGPVGAGRTS